jgi:pimeloyl-ACP methyl ester carboxylesterase
MVHRVILLPGVVLPAELAYGGLIEALGERADARARDLALYAADEPPPDYGLDLEIDALMAAADAAGFDRFHLVGYSAGGAIAAVTAARRPGRLLSLALLEPAWLGNAGISEPERRARERFESVRRLPADERMAAFVRAQLAPGVEPPPPPPGAAAPWMSKRPAGISALTECFAREELDHDALSAFRAPAYFALGGLSNPDLYREMAARCERLLPDFRLEVFPERHHFDPPHRAEPQALARSLLGLWERSRAR